MRPGRWKCLGVVGATLPLWIPAPYRGTGQASDRRNDELRGRNDEGRPRNIIFVPMTKWGRQDEMGWGVTNSAVGLPASASDLG